jgi:hypothetical protein
MTPNGGGTTREYVRPSDVVDELNFIERMRNELSSGDEFLEAILTNQRLLALQIIQRMQEQTGRSLPVDAVDTENDGSPAGYRVDARPVPEGKLINDSMVPLDAVGLANRTIYENDIGPATFQVNGTVFATTIRVTEDVGSGDPIRVVAPGNITEAVGDVALSLLGLPGSIGVGTFDVAETDDNVEIQPGETAHVLRVTVGGGDWVSVGTNDETHTEYQYTIDGEELLETPLKEPLGLYNDPYKFPTPLSADQTFGVKVTRQNSASGAAEYYSKAAYFD